MVPQAAGIGDAERSRERLMRLTMRRISLLLCALVLIAGCPKREPTVETSPPPASRHPQDVAAPMPETSAPEEARAEQPAKPSAPRTARAESPRARWAIPDGPLDDEKFVVMSAKYAAAVESLDEDARSEENMRLVLREVLKEANVTEQEYSAYAEEAAKDPERAERLTKQIEYAMKSRGFGKLRGQVTKQRPQ